MDRERLRENALKDFHEQGYVVLEQVFSTDELTELQRIVETLIEGANEEENQHNDGHWNSQGYLFNKPPNQIPHEDVVSRYLHKIQGVCTLNSYVLEKIFKHPAITSTVQEIINGCGIDVFGTKFFPVYPGGNSVSWHQDSHYFGTGPSQKIVSVAVYLEPTDVENGCLRLIPGSHSDGVEHAHVQGRGKWMQGEWVDVESNESLNSRIIDLVCKNPGTVVLFDARLLHAANENRSSDRTRWSFFGHYVPGDLNFFLAWR